MTIRRVDGPTGWRKNEKGNYCRTLDGKLCTVFFFDAEGFSSGEDGWKFVCDGYFSEDVFDSAEDAADAATEIYGDENEEYDCGF